MEQGTELLEASSTLRLLATSRQTLVGPHAILSNLHEELTPFKLGGKLKGKPRASPGLCRPPCLAGGRLGPRQGDAASYIINPFGKSIIRDEEEAAAKRRVTCFACSADEAHQMRS